VVTEFSVVHVNWVQLNFTIDMSSLSIKCKINCVYLARVLGYALVGWWIVDIHQDNIS